MQRIKLKTEPVMTSLNYMRNNSGVFLKEAFQKTDVSYVERYTDDEGEEGFCLHYGENGEYSNVQAWVVMPGWFLVLKNGIVMCSMSRTDFTETYEVVCQA